MLSLLTLLQTSREELHSPPVTRLLHQQTLYTHYGIYIKHHSTWIKKINNYEIVQKKIFGTCVTQGEGRMAGLAGLGRHDAHDHDDDDEDDTNEKTCGLAVS